MKGFGIVCVPYNRISIAATVYASAGHFRLAAMHSATMQSRFKVLALLLLLAVPLPSFAALAEELSEVTRLHRAGQSAAALERADRYLATAPRDAQMRFLKSVLLADTGRSSEALALLTQLVQDYPELAEPHNNLAALHAAAGDYAKARAALEEAIRLNPGYAPAHENLGDVHVMLATQAYARALRLEPASPSLPRKLALARQLPAPAPARQPDVSNPRGTAAASAPR
ncbi:MAG TPA: tetratricopeptide repeat protein [Caldimonas sp.]|nr:tetratricopeptide repeat protein [Caldimonas sp.]HEX2541017.1 tetratricopeptide repeat protein [Caldimonas sp.]